MRGNLGSPKATDYASCTNFAQHISASSDGAVVDPHQLNLTKNLKSDYLLRLGVAAFHQANIAQRVSCTRQARQSQYKPPHEQVPRPSSPEIRHLEVPSLDPNERRPTSDSFLLRQPKLTVSNDSSQCQLIALRAPVPAQNRRFPVWPTESLIFDHPDGRTSRVPSDLLIALKGSVICCHNGEPHNNCKFRMRRR